MTGSAPGPATEVKKGSGSAAPAMAQNSQAAVVATATKSPGVLETKSGKGCGHMEPALLVPALPSLGVVPALQPPPLKRPAAAAEAPSQKKVTRGMAAEEEGHPAAEEPAVTEGAEGKPAQEQPAQEQPAQEPDMLQVPTRLSPALSLLRSTKPEVLAPPGVDTVCPVFSRGEKAALRSKFYRTLEQPVDRAGCAEEDRCGPELALEIKNDPQGMGHWFQRFLKHKGLWSEVQLELESERIQEDGDEGEEVEMTRDQMIAHFHNVEVVDDMIEFLSAQPDKWTANPNAPTSQQGRIYKVIVNKKKTWRNRNMDRRRLRAKGDLTNEGAAGLLEQLGTRGGLCASAIAAPLLPAEVPKAAPLPAPAVEERATPAKAPSLAATSATVAASPSAELPPGLTAAQAAKLRQLQTKEEEKAAKKQSKADEAKKNKDDRDKKKHEDKMEKERVAALPTSKAAKWSEGLNRDIGQLMALQGWRFK